MKIALFVHSFAGGGAQRRVLTLAGGFAARGHRVDLVVVHATGPLRGELPPGVRLVELGGRLARLPAMASRRPRQVTLAIPALIRYLRGCRPDVLLAGANHVNLQAAWAHRLARRADTALVLCASNHLSRVASPAAAGASRAGKRRAVRRFYPWADAIVAISDGVAEDLVANAALPRRLITTIHNPVAVPAIAARAGTPVDHPWFAPGAPPVVLGVGRLHPQKDFPTLLRAFARARVRCPARLVILGEGPERARLEALARGLDLADDVQLPGFVADPWAYMARAAVFVLSSAWEGFGNAVVEALACGCPVVSTDCPSGPREILADGAYGVLVPVGDAAALAGAIAATLDAPPEPGRLRRRAEAYSVDAAVDRYLAVLAAAVDAARRRR